MSERISEMVHRADNQTIKKYVKNHLPNDVAGLQRIYKQLLTYNPAESKPSREQRTLSLKNTSRSSHKLSEVGDRQSQQTHKMIKMLKEKGLKGGEGTEQKGMQVFERARQKIVKPLIANKKVLRSQEAAIDRLIERYNVNEGFYNNSLEDVEVNLEKVVDRDMKEFISRRQKVLSSLIHNKLDMEDTFPNSRYQQVTNKVYKQTLLKIPFEAEPQLKKSPNSQRRLSQTKQLLANCHSSLTKRESHSVPSNNLFSELQQKLQAGGDELDKVDMDTLFAFKKLKEKMAKQQYDRYTHTYMKMVSTKTEGGQCKLNSYAKQLLQDARKMRNIIDFSKH